MKWDEIAHSCEGAVEGVLFWSRWLLAIFFVGLVVAIAMMIPTFLIEMWKLGLSILHQGSDPGAHSEVIVSLLSLVDTALIATLLLIIAFSGYENFVSKIDIRNQTDRPEWMGKVNFSDLKIKLIGVMVAITALELLRASLNIEGSRDKLIWIIAIHLAFVISGVLFALTDRIAARNEYRGPAKKKEEGDSEAKAVKAPGG